MEPEVHYPQWRKINQAVERHHALHDSLIKLLEGKNKHIWENLSEGIIILDRTVIDMTSIDRSK